MSFPSSYVCNTTGSPAAHQIKGEVPKQTSECAAGGRGQASSVPSGMCAISAPALYFYFIFLPTSLLFSLTGQLGVGSIYLGCTSYQTISNTFSFFIFFELKQFRRLHILSHNFKVNACDFTLLPHLPLLALSSKQDKIRIQ